MGVEEGRLSHRLSRRRMLALAAGGARAGAWTALASALAARAGAAPAAVATAPAAGEKDVPWLAEVQQPPAGAVKAPVSLRPLLADAAGKPVATLEAWTARRQEIRRDWLGFLGQMKPAPPAPKLEVLEEDRPAGCIRQRVRYHTETDLAVEGYLLRPDRPGKGRPGVVVLHSTTSTTIRQGAGLAGEPEKAFGLSLAGLGCVTFCPVCFLWVGTGSYEQRVEQFQRRHPGCKGMAKMLWDAQRGLDVLAAQDDVDPARLGAVGHSLGGKEVLYLAALDERVKAAVSSEGGVGTTYCNWNAPWYLGKTLADWTAGGRHEHHELLALAAPRAFLLVGGDASDGDRSWPFIQAALDVYRLYTPRPRLGLLNHKKGHSVPPTALERIHQWLTTYL